MIPNAKALTVRYKDFVFISLPLAIYAYAKLAGASTDVLIDVELKLPDDEGDFYMRWTYDQAVELLRSWRAAKDSPILIVELAIPWLAYATALGEVDKITEDSVTLIFGRQAWGAGVLTVPLLTAQFTYVEQGDKRDVHVHNNDRMVGCLELKFPGNPDGGCYITEIKPGIFTYIDRMDRVVLEMK